MLVIFVPSGEWTTTWEESLLLDINSISCLVSVTSNVSGFVTWATPNGSNSLECFFVFVWMSCRCPSAAVYILEPSNLRRRVSPLMEMYSWLPSSRVRITVPEGRIVRCISILEVLSNVGRGILYGLEIIERGTYNKKRIIYKKNYLQEIDNILRYSNTLYYWRNR